jgi:ribosome biogenesis ATPase
MSSLNDIIRAQPAYHKKRSYETIENKDNENKSNGTKRSLLSSVPVASSSSSSSSSNQNKTMENSYDSSNNLESLISDNVDTPTSGKKQLKGNKDYKKRISDKSVIEDDISASIMKNLDQKHRNSSNFLVPRPSTRLTDLAGLDTSLDQVRDMVFYPIQYPDLYSHLGVRPPCGLLFHGPSGCGKTALAHAIAGELDLPFYKASGPELIGGTSGESEERIREVFKTAISNSPCVLFIDAIDVIAGKKESSQRGMDRRILAQLSDSIDDINNMGDNEDNNKCNNIINDKKFSLNPNLNSITHVSSSTTTTSSNNNMVILIAATNKY